MYASGLFLSGAIRGGAAIAALASQFIIIKVAGETAYGRYSLYITAISFLCIFSKMGADVSALRQIAILNEESSEALIRSVTATLISSAILLSPTICLLYYLLAPKLGVSQAGIVATLLGVVSLTATSQVVSILRGLSRNGLADALDGLTRPILLTAICIPFALWADPDNSVVLAYVLSSFILLVVMGAVAERERVTQGIKTSFFYFYKISLGDMKGNFSSLQVFASIFSFALFQLDTYLLGRHADIVTVGGYNLASSYVRLVIFVPLIISARSQARLARAWHLKDLIGFRLCLRRDILYSVCCAVLGFAFLAGCSTFLMERASSKYAGLALPLTVLAAGHCFNSVAIICIGALNMSRRNDAVMISTGTGAFVAVLGYFVLIPRGGALGASSGAALGMLTMTLTASAMVIRQIRRS